MKHPLIFVFLLTCSIGFSQWSNTAFVHRSGSDLIDGTGKKVALNGVNLGGWLLWEGWIWGGGLRSETAIDRQLTALYGNDSTALFKEEIHRNYITEDDIRQIAALGLNTVRVPFNHTLLESDEQPYVYREKGFERLDSLLHWCEKYNVYAVLDLHSAPGGQNGFFISDPDKETLWKSAANKKRTVALWHAIAKRYAGRGVVAGYDLLNEPKTNQPEELVKLYRRIIDTIRTVDGNHLVIVEGNNLAQKFDLFTTVPDPNMAFSFHYYTWFNEKDKLRTLQPHIDFCRSKGIPMWCGEWGEDSRANVDEVRRLLEDPAYGFCGNAFWTWKKVYKDNNKLPVSEILFPANARIVVKWIAGVGKKPTAEQAKAGWSEIFKAVHSSGCRLNAQMQEALKH